MPETSNSKSYTIDCHDVVHVVEFSPYEWSSQLIGIGTSTRVTIGTCIYDDVDVDGIEFNLLRNINHETRVTAFAWSPDTLLMSVPKVIRFCTGGADRKLRLFYSDLKAEDCVQVLEGHTDYINEVSFDPEKGDHLASVSDDHTCRIWDSEGTQKACLSLSSPGMAVKWHAEDTNKILVAEKKGLIRFYSVLTQQPIMSLECGASPLLSADWCLRNALRVTALAGTDWFVFDTSRSSRPIDSRQAHGGGGQVVRWSKSHDYLLATIGTPGAQVRVFNIKTYQVLVSADLAMCSGLSWHYHQPLVAVGGDKKVHIWIAEPF